MKDKPNKKSTNKDLFFEYTQCFPLRASHRLKISKDKYEPLHGHTYKVCITLKSDHLDAHSQWVSNRDQLTEIAVESLLKKFDKSYLNDILEFTAGETLVKEIFDILKQTRIGSLLKQVMIIETTKNTFIYSQSE